MSQEVKTTEDSLAIASQVDVAAGGELQLAAETAAAIQEIQAAVVLAKKFPRSYQAVWGKLMEACERKSMAEVAEYSYPRGGNRIAGPSVNIARVAAQIYGNIRWGLDILRDDQGEVLIRGWAWDIESNVKISADDRFKKLVQRKRDGQTVWLKPDERDLRELINRRGAILVRNCLLQILPKDYIEDAIGVCHKTRKSAIKDPKGESKKLILAFGKLGVSPEMLAGYIGSDSWAGDEIVELQNILNAINDGTARKADYFGGVVAEPKKKSTGTLSEKDMKAGDSSKHQGHEPEKKKGGKKTAAKKSDEKKEDPEQDERKALYEKITNMEGTKDLGGKKVPDLRMEALDLLDLPKASIDQLMEYAAVLAALDNKNQKDNDAGF